MNQLNAESVQCPSTNDVNTMNKLPSLVGLDKGRIKDIITNELGEKAFRSKQLWSWIYHHGVQDYDVMSNLGKQFRADLGGRYGLDRDVIQSHQQSVDGTQKWLMKTRDGNEVESVYIPEEDRGTLCVSSQVGCTLNCRFCHTGTQRLVRNLTAAEIVGQVIIARDILGDWPSSKENRRLTNIVMMGMGEPLLNYDEVAKALLMMMDGDGIALSRRKITLSTSGIVPLMKRCGEELGVNLAVSLHATRDDVRDYIVPINKKYNIKELLQACRDYPGVSNARRITFEYVMLDGVNDSDQDARELVALLSDIPSKVNLIPFNPWPGSFFKTSSNNRIRRFADIVMKAGYASPVRKPRGQDILAACGQLKTESVKQRKSLQSVKPKSLDYDGVDRALTTASHYRPDEDGMRHQKEIAAEN